MSDCARPSARSRIWRASASTRGPSTTGWSAVDRLINNPFHYRDERTARGVDLVHKIADHATLYAANGLQFQPFNSVYQLAVDQEAGVIDDSDHDADDP